MDRHYLAKGTVNNCYSKAVVHASSFAGGLIATVASSTNVASVTNCYSTGNVTASSGVGGLVYDRGTNGTVNNSFWDTETSGQATSPGGGTGKTTEDMKTQSVFSDAGWDFTTIWEMDGTTNNGYAFLQSHEIPAPPTVSTQAVTDIGKTTATGNGNITDLGISNPTQHGVCWSTSINPTIALATKTQQGAITETGAFTSSITGLSPSTTYHVRAYASNIGGTSYGDDVIFETSSPFSGGDGSAGNPYLISSLADLQVLSLYSAYWSSHYQQTANIDAWETSTWNPDGSGGYYGFSPIGNATTKFTGSYNGQGYRIDELYINRGTSDNVGLFGYVIANAVISNVGIANANITGRDYTGCLIGRGYTTIVNCFTTGSVNGAQYTGGIIGSLYTAASSINNCNSKASVTGTTNVGGLIGYIVSCTANNCYSRGTVNGTSIIGGMIGYANLATTTNSYSTGAVSGTSSKGGFLGSKYLGSVTNCFFDYQTAGTSTSAGGTAKTTLAMKNQTTFTDAGWDFVVEETNGTNDYWDMQTIRNNGYAFLSWETFPAIITTQAVSNIAATSATGNGNVTELGTTNPTQHGVCWNTSGTPTLRFDNKTEQGAVDETGAFTSTITGLQLGVTYYVRAYATNASGTSYGNQVSFTTDYRNVSWTGTLSTLWNNAANWDVNEIPTSDDNVVVPDVSGLSGNNPSIATGVDISCNNLTVDINATLIVEGGGTLLTSGTTTNNGTFAIESGGSFMDNGTLSGSGTYDVTREITGSVWHLVSSPISDGTANTFNGNYLQTWDETLALWTDISDPDLELIPAKGYGLWGMAGKGNYTFTGTPNTGTLNFDITYTNLGTTENDGANLVGNPYPSSIDWSGLDDTYGAVYCWDHANTRYTKWVNGSGTNGGLQFIPPTQGFFIVANADMITETSGKFTVANTNRTHQGATTYFKGYTASKPNSIRLEAQNGNLKNELLLLTDKEATPGFDVKYDAYHLLSGTPGMPEFYSVPADDTRKLSIDSRPEIQTIQLGFSNNLPGIYTIAIKEIADITSAMLEDTKTNTFHNLQNGPYDFAWEVADDEMRFKLHLNAVGIQENQISESNILIYAANNQIFIKGAEDGEVMVSDMMGRIISHHEISSEGLISIPGNLKTGVYLVTVKSGNGLKTEKIFIN